MKVGQNELVVAMERACTVVFVLYNVMCAGVLLFAPSAVEQRFFRQVRSEPGTLFLLHSIASFHGYVALLSLSSLSLFDARSRRLVSWLGCLLNAYDAASQLLYWGPRCWTDPEHQIWIDVGVPAVIAIVAAVGALSARDKKRAVH